MRPLQKGDISEDGSVRIVDVDRLCYLVESNSRGARGLRTISKELLKEYIDYWSNHPNSTSNEARAALSGQSDIDKYEYGYTATLSVMAGMYLKGSLRNQPHSSQPLQVIYYGAPGTGKSYQIKSLQATGKKLIRTTFHPDSDYASFVGCYKPVVKSAFKNTLSLECLKKCVEEELAAKDKKSPYQINKFVVKYYASIRSLEESEKDELIRAIEKKQYGDKESHIKGLIPEGIAIGKYLESQGLLCDSQEMISYAFVPQAFLKAYTQAWKHYPEPQYLVIEEINRGNCAQIFGDLFQLLDRNSEGFSEYPIAADSDICKYLEEHFQQDGSFAPDERSEEEINALYSDEYEDAMGKVKSGELLLLPKNLHILATMNTSDQSLFPIDSAFKRRWEWEYFPIRNAQRGWVIEAAGKTWDWWTFLEQINSKIGSVTDSEDKKLGYFFVKPQDNQTISADTFVSKVIFYLWNDVFKDYGFSDKEFQTAAGGQMTFPMFYETEVQGQRVNEELVAQFLDILINGDDTIEEADSQA